MPKPEQTEKPTAKRKGEARGRGQVARSPDVASSVIFLFFIIVLKIAFIPGIDSAGAMMKAALQHLHQSHDFTIYAAWNGFVRAMWTFSLLLEVLFGAAIVLGIGSNLAQFGFLFQFNSLKPKFSRLNPIAGISGILISLRSLTNLLKQVIKLTIVFTLCYTSLVDHVDELMGLSGSSPHAILMFMDNVLFSLGLRFGLLMFVLAIIDYAYEKWQLERSLKMSKSEVKDETRQAEGNPEAKSAMKSRQRSAARKRMMAAVPKATVVVTNPTHFAVALEWDDVKMDAPVLTAKGADLMAKRIRELAKEHNVPILENPPLARTLYNGVPLDTPIPPTMYAAVAQVIAFVYKLKNKTIA